MSASLRILIIDDDEVDRRIVMRSLKSSTTACDVIQASTAAEGLRIAAEDNHFDAILLDYRLPDQDGLEVLRALRSGEFNEAAVIMLSRMEDDSLAERCLESGAQDFLLKDEVNTRRLSRAVRQARQRHAMESDLRRSREQLRYLSERDPLTDLTNRRGFEFALESAMARCRRSSSKVAVLLLDLDDFKLVNDTLGHDAGDLLLKKIAQKLGEIVRESDLLCRLGGDEFVVLMNDLEQTDQAILLANRIISILQEPISINGISLVTTASIGIATLDISNKSAVDLLKCADIAMYQAKQEGRNKSRFYSAALQDAVHAKAHMRTDLQNALKQRQLKVFYQAQISSADGSLGGIEALLRWQHPRLGLLSPGSFLETAEETGLIVEIGNWALKEACKQLHAWQSRYARTCPKLAVNFSATQIKHGSLLETLKETLDKYELDTCMLELEITENALITDTSTIASTLSSTTNLGINLSLDDFGTGYSSLEHLKLFPISVLKIDKGFVSSVGTDQKGEQLLVAIISFAKALGIKVVAEGIESKRQADFCSRHGCDLLQGYYYSLPVPADEFESIFFAPAEKHLSWSKESNLALR